LVPTTAYDFSTSLRRTEVSVRCFFSQVASYQDPILARPISGTEMQARYTLLLQQKFLCEHLVDNPIWAHCGLTDVLSHKIVQEGVIKGIRFDVPVSGSNRDQFLVYLVLNSICLDVPCNIHLSYMPKSCLEQSLGPKILLSIIPK